MRSGLPQDVSPEVSLGSVKRTMEILQDRWEWLAAGDIKTAIQIRKDAERKNKVKIMEGVTKEYYGGPFKIRCTVTEDNLVWFFAGDMSECLGMAANYFGKFTDRIPAHMQGLIHINHGKRAYRAYSLEGALTFLSYIKENTEDFKRWLLMHVYPATVMTNTERLSMAKHLIDFSIKFNVQGGQI